MPAAHIRVPLLLLALMLLGCQAQDAASSCSFVMRQGIYNTYMSSSSGSSYTAAQSAFCRYDESYTESQYRQDLAKAQSGAYSETSSQFKDIQVGASYGPFSASVGFTTDNSQSSSSKYMTAESFSTYQAQASAMKSSSCASSSSESQARQAASVLQQTIDPNVIAAYVSCLDLFKLGVQTRTSAAPDAQNLALDIKFIGQTANSKVRITRIEVWPANSAVCTVTSATGTGTPKPFGQVITLTTNRGVTVSCTVVARRAPKNKRSDIVITTDLGGTWRGMLFHSPDSTEVAKLTQTAQQMQAEAKQLSELLASTQAGIKQLREQLAATNTKLAPIGIDGRRVFVQSICLGPSNSHNGNICINGARGGGIMGGPGEGDYMGAQFRSQDGQRTYAVINNGWDALIVHAKQDGGNPYFYVNKDANYGIFPYGDGIIG